MNSYLAGCAVLGAGDWEKPFDIDEVDSSWGAPVMVLGVVIGMFDLNTVQQQMNTLKSGTVGIAQSLLSGGLTVINQAIQIGNSNSLPGGTDRNNVLAHLQWHQNKLATFGANVNAMYDSFDDLKKWCTEAFIESNAAEEGAAWISNAWDAMWTEIATKIAALPAQVRHAVAAAVDNITGLPIWAWGVIIAGTLGLLGFATYKLANTRAGEAIARHYVP